MVAPNLQITAFGSHPSTTLALLGHPGVVTVSGASGVGKSLLIDALVFALVGTQRDGRPFDVRTIRNGADKCEVKAEIGGSRIKASVTRAGSWTRAVDGINQPNQREHHTAIGIGGMDDVVRFIVAPMLTPGLLGKELGRPLRDLLLSVLPEIDPRGVIAAMLTERGLQLDPSDVVDEAGAMVALTTANRARDVATGALQRSEGALQAIATPSAGPTEAEVAAARTVVATGALWAAYDRAVAAESNARAATADRDARRRVLEETIAAPVTELVPADQVVAADAVIALDAAWTVYRQALADHRYALGNREVAEIEQARRVKAREALGEMPGAIVIDTAPIDAEITAVERGLASLKSKSVPCGECGAPKHADPARVAKGETKLAELREKRAEAVEANRAALAARVSWERSMQAIGPDVVIPEIGPAPVEPARTVTPEEVKAARETIKRAELAESQRSGDLQRRAAAEAELQRFPVDTVSTHAPVAPTEPRPALAVEAGAVDTVRRAETVAATRAAIEAQRARAEAAAKADRETLDAATTTATRKAAVLDCARKAPSIIADRQRALFGDLGCVQLRFPPDEGRSTAAIEILVETEDAAGHVEIVPWDRASTGWRILADLHLRAAVRRLSGLDWLPIFVDEAQSWSGDYPEIPGLIQLWTTEAGSPLSVAIP